MQMVAGGEGVWVAVLEEEGVEEERSVAVCAEDYMTVQEMQEI